MENHHVASSWLLTIQDEKCDIFSNLKGDDYKLVRQRMISMVLSTDMSAHFGDLAKTKARVSSQGKIKEFKFRILISNKFILKSIVLIRA